MDEAYACLATRVLGLTVLGRLSCLLSAHMCLMYRRVMLFQNILGMRDMLSRLK